MSTTTTRSAQEPALRATPITTPAAKPADAVRLTHLRKSFGDVDAVDGIDVTEGLAQMRQPDCVCGLCRGSRDGSRPKCGLLGGPGRCRAHGSRLVPRRLRSMAHRSPLAHDISQGASDGEVPLGIGRNPRSGLVMAVKGAEALRHDMVEATYW